MTRWMPVLLACVLSACGSSRYCMVEQDYQTATLVPELKPTDDLAVPQSPSALKLPPAPKTSTPFGQQDDEGNNVCLDKPPRFNFPAAASAAPVAAPAAAPAPAVESAPVPDAAPAPKNDAS